VLPLSRTVSLSHGYNQEADSNISFVHGSTSFLLYSVDIRASSSIFRNFLSLTGVHSFSVDFSEYDVDTVVENAQRDINSEAVIVQTVQQLGFSREHIDAVMAKYHPTTVDELVDRLIDPSAKISFEPAQEKAEIQSRRLNQSDRSKSFRDEDETKTAKGLKEEV
jgi:hypothetical protein